MSITVTQLDNGNLGNWNFKTMVITGDNSIKSCVTGCNALIRYAINMGGTNAVQPVWTLNSTAGTEGNQAGTLYSIANIANGSTAYVMVVF